MLSARFFFRSSMLMLIALLILFPFISQAFQFIWGLLFSMASSLAALSLIDLIFEKREQHEREADTKVPSDNGVEPFGKRDTTAHLINKGRNTRW